MTLKRKLAVVEKEKVSKLFYRWILPIVFGLLLLVYRPALLEEFGIHNDYTLVFPNLANRDVFMESRHLMLIARPVQVIFLTLQSWFINRIDQIVWSRRLSFVFMLTFVWFFSRFLSRKFGIEKFWLVLIGLAVMLHPSSQLKVMYATLCFPGFFTILSALWAYEFWDASRVQKGPKKILPLLGSCFLFMTALMNYQINAMFVFVCSFAVLFFSPKDEWPQVRKIIAADILFFGVNMVVYFVVSMKILVPWAEKHLSFMQSNDPFMGGPYVMTVSQTFLPKARLFVETFWIALANNGYLFWGFQGGWIPFVILVGIVGAWFGVKRKSIALSVFLQKVAGGVFLFFLANSPTFVAKGCTWVMGYRVLLPASVLLILWQFGMLRTLFEGERRPRLKVFLKGLAIVLVIVSALGAGKNIRDVVLNYKKELACVREFAEGIDYDHVSRVKLIRLPQHQGVSFIHRRLPFEFSRMITDSQLARPMLEEVAAEKGVPNISVDVDDQDQVYFDEHTVLLDFNKIVPLPLEQDPKPLVRVSVSALEGQRVDIDRQGPFFAFRQERMGKDVPYWTAISRTEIPPWLELHYLDEPVVLQEFVFGVFSSRIYKADPVECILQGSVDGTSWVDLKARPIFALSSEANTTFYYVFNPGQYSQYRFYLILPGGGRPFNVLSIYLETRFAQEQ